MNVSKFFYLKILHIKYFNIKLLKIKFELGFVWCIFNFKDSSDKIYINQSFKRYFYITCHKKTILFFLQNNNILLFFNVQK